VAGVDGSGRSFGVLGTMTDSMGRTMPISIVAGERERRERRTRSVGSVGDGVGDVRSGESDRAVSQSLVDRLVLVGCGLSLLLYGLCAQAVGDFVSEVGRLMQKF
jgi:hypothetical protein